MPLRRAARTLLLLLALPLLATSCGDDADGRRLHCTGAETFLAVRVVDAGGAPVEDATVTATRTTGGAAQSETTDGEGVARFDESSGPGTLRLSARSGSKVSSAGEATWVCGECDCTVTPSSLTLTLP